MKPYLTRVWDKKIRNGYITLETRIVMWYSFFFPAVFLKSSRQRALCRSSWIFGTSGTLLDLRCEKDVNFRKLYLCLFFLWDFISFILLMVSPFPTMFFYPFKASFLAKFYFSFSNTSNSVSLNKDFKVILAIKDQYGPHFFFLLMVGGWLYRIIVLFHRPKIHFHCKMKKQFSYKLE